MTRKAKLFFINYPLDQIVSVLKQNNSNNLNSEVTIYRLGSNNTCDHFFGLVSISPKGDEAAKSLNGLEAEEKDYTISELKKGYRDRLYGERDLSLYLEWQNE